MFAGFRGRVDGVYAGERDATKRMDPVGYERNC